MDAVAKEQWALALLTARFDCAQQKFFQAEYGRSRRSPAVALALCLLLGAFGAHEFYLGRLRSAALRLLFCWTLIPLALALVDALYLTRRVHAYNRAMAHTLVEIIDETYAAVHEHAAAREHAAAPERTAWQVGAARTYIAAEATRWPHEAPTTTPLAEEREALTSASPVEITLAEAPTLVAAVGVAASPPPMFVAPVRSVALSTAQEFPYVRERRRDKALLVAATAPLDEPVFGYSAPISRRVRERLGPSLDALLADLTTLADEAEAQRASQTTAPLASSVPLISTVELISPPAPEPAPPEPVVTAALRDDYAKMMATEEPAPAIMGAGPADAVAATTSLTPSRIQRIIVRKVAMVDGRLIAEASATRDAIICGSDDEVAARIEAATEEARVEAMRLLATLVPSEMLAQAQTA